MPKIQTDFTITGERAYKQAISEINSGLGVLNSEMKKVTAQYQDNADSVEALTAKGDVLERTLLSQKEKVEELRRALDNAKDQYGEADKRTMEWEKSLNNAEAAVANTESAIRKNNEALEQARNGMEDTGEASVGLTKKITDLAGEFGIKLPGGLDKALSGMNGFSAGSVTAIAAVTAAVGAMTKAYKEMIDLTVASASNADNVLTLAQITGLSTDTIQEMQYASELIDVSFETIKGSMTKLKNNMQDARNGNEKLTESFQALNVHVTNADGSLRNAESVFYDVIDALGDIQNVTERDALAMDLFGKKAEDLNPLIIQGSDRMRELSEEAHNMGYVMSGETLEALGKVDDAYQRLGKTQDTIKNQMADQMAPTVEDLHETWADFTKEGGELLVKSGIIKGTGELLQTLLALFEPLKAVIDLMTPANEQFSLVYQVLHGIAMTIAWIEDTANAGIGFFTYLFDGGQRWRTAMGQNAAYGQYSHMQQIDGTAQAYDAWRESNTYDPSTGQWSSNYGGIPSNAAYDENTGRYYNPDTGWYYNASGNMHFMGGRTILGENGPEAVELPEGTRIYNAQDTRRGAGSVYIDKVIVDASSVKEFNDIVEIVEDLRVVRRMG